MNNYKEAIRNLAGQVLPGYKARVLDSSGDIVDIFSDAGGTPWLDNECEADENGNAIFYYEAQDGLTLQHLDLVGNVILSDPDFADNLLAKNGGPVEVDQVTGLGASLDTRPVAYETESALADAPISPKTAIYNGSTYSYVTTDESANPLAIASTVDTGFWVPSDITSSRDFQNLGQLAASNFASSTVGRNWKAGGFRYSETDPSATNQAVTTSGGVKLLEIGPRFSSMKHLLNSPFQGFLFQTAELTSFHEGLDLGGGKFQWDQTKPKSEHNGGTIVSPTVPFNGTLAAFLAGTGETESGEATGCWVRVDASGQANTAWFGAKCDDEADDFAAVQKAVFVSAKVYQPGMSQLSQTVKISSNNFSITGDLGTSGFRVTGSFGALAPSALFFAEGGFISGLTFTSNAPGVGFGLNGSVDLYFSNWHIVDCSFEKRLRFGIAANFIGCALVKCKFGVFGNNADEPHQAMKIEGQSWTLGAAARTSNQNVIRDCWILNSKMVNHAVEIVNGMHWHIGGSTVIEKCTPTISAVRFAGVNNPVVKGVWFEASNGTTFIKCDAASDAPSVDQGTLVVEDCQFSFTTAPGTLVQFTGTNKQLSFRGNRGVQALTFPVASGGAQFMERVNNQFTGADGFAAGFRLGDDAFFWSPSATSAFAGATVTASSRTGTTAVAISGLKLGIHALDVSYSENLAGAQLHAYVDSAGLARYFFANVGATVVIPAGTVTLKARRMS